MSKVSPSAQLQFFPLPPRPVFAPYLPFRILGVLAWIFRSGLSAALPPHQLSPVLTLLFPLSAPTHNLTLSRTAREIVELDNKLRDAYPSVLRPSLFAALPHPVKRQSVVINMPSRVETHPSAADSPVPSALPTAVVSPKAEIVDPVLGEVAVGTSTSANPTITGFAKGFAAYLTTLSNDRVFRQARPWKRFVRVRPDDLERVRAERAIRRVRSDVAAHLSSPSTVDVDMHKPSVLDDTRRKLREDSLNGNAPVLERRASRSRENIDDTEKQDNNSLHNTDPASSLISENFNMLVPDLASTAPSANSDVIEIEASDNGSIVLPAPHTADANAPAPTTGATPPPTELPARIPRSQSTEPDKAARLSRVLAQSATSVGVSGTETASASASATEDDSSVNTSRERKKRSKSTARIKERVSRKVQVSDFEMMRVLGK